MSKRSAVIVIIVIAVAAAGYVVFTRTAGQKQKPSAVQSPQQVQDTWEDRARTLEAEVAELKQEITSQDSGVDQEHLEDVFGSPPREDGQDQTAQRTPGEKAQHFFTYLDHKGYLKTRGIDEPAIAYFSSLAERLKQNRPAVSEETRDMYTLLKNITFFFRVLGKENLFIVKDIIQGERDILEPAMEVLYEWIQSGGEETGASQPPLTPDMLYDYAAFFMQTIAGQAYLYRRDSKTRIVTAFYSILVLDDADRRGNNRYGIDLRPHIDALRDDIRNQRNLAYRSTYLETLGRIRQTY